jgi:uncharacterized membrane-anchored protein
VDNLEHPARGAALGELHARPAALIEEHASILRVVFGLPGGEPDLDRELITKVSVAAGQAAPAPAARHHQVMLGDTQLRWERHNEFVTYTFIGPAGQREASRTATVWDEHMKAAPGLLIARIAIDVAPMAHRDGPGSGRMICASRVYQAQAVMETSFLAEPDGTVRFRLASDGLAASQRGTLVQAVLEIETYRVLALLALPLARRIGAEVGKLESDHIRLTEELVSQKAGDVAEALYLELTALASRIEAEIAACTYRFAAVRAYAQIVEDRLRTMGEVAHDDRPQVGAFLTARLIPAVRTCESMQTALQDLARRCARSADLIRTRIDLQLARQNNELLSALNERTQLQMRLQQTVEGLSVAAVSYYILGLIGYALKGAKEASWMPFDPTVATAVLLPVVVIVVLLGLRRVRRLPPEQR